MATAFDPRAFQNNAFQIDSQDGHSGIVRLQLAALYEQAWAEDAARKATIEQEKIANATPITPAVKRVLRQQPKPNPLIDEPEEEPIRWLDIIGAISRAAMNRADASVAAARFVLNAAYAPMPAPIKIRYADESRRRQRQLKQIAAILPMLESYA